MLDREDVLASEQRGLRGRREAVGMEFAAPALNTGLGKKNPCSAFLEGKTMRNWASTSN